MNTNTNNTATTTTRGDIGATTTRSRHRARWAAIGAAVAVSLGGGGLMTASAAGQEEPTFHPITPCRIMDTRPGVDNVGPRVAPIGPDETYQIPTTGAQGNCNVPFETTAIAMNVTIVNPTAASYLSVAPGGAPTPLSSNLNWVAGQAATPNAVTVDVAGDGTIAFYNRYGWVDVIADVVGYYSDHEHDDRYYTQSQVDGMTMFAVVEADGTLRRGSDGVTSTPHPSAFDGDYIVTFPRSVSDCGFTASAQSTVEGNNPTVGIVGATVRSSNQTQLYVQANDADGVRADRPFSVLVACPAQLPPPPP